MAETKTPEEIAELKRQWMNDGVWDIEDTEGFEAHHDELLAWRLQYKAEQERKALEMEERRQIITIRTRVFSGGDRYQEMVDADDEISQYMASGWQVASVSVVSGDSNMTAAFSGNPVLFVDRYVTLVRKVSATATGPLVLFES